MRLLLRYVPHKRTNAALLAISIILLVSTIVWEGETLSALFCSICVLLYGILYAPYNDVEWITRTANRRFHTITNVLLLGVFLLLAIAHAALNQGSIIAWLVIPLMSWAVLHMICEVLYVFTGHDDMLRRFRLI